MGVGYTRADSSNAIANGETIDADVFDAEYNAIEAAFAASTGHTHDGTTAEGGPITVIGPAQDIVASGTNLNPKTNNVIDLGTSSLRYKDIFLTGTVNVGANTAVTSNRTVSAGAGLTGGGNLGADITISHIDTSTQVSVNNSGGNVVQDIFLDTYGHVTSIGSVNLDTLYVPLSRAISAGGGMAGGGVLSADVTVSHADTSSQASLTNTGGTVIQSVAVDTYGHITALAVADLDTRYAAKDGPFVATATGSQSAPVFQLGSTGLGFYRDSLSQFLAVTIGGTQCARFEGAGTTVASTLAVITREKGDERYAQRSRTITAGAGLTGGGDLAANLTIAHADTSSVSNTSNAVEVPAAIFNLTFDTYGHVQTVDTITVTPAPSSSSTAGETSYPIGTYLPVQHTTNNLAINSTQLLGVISASRIFTLQTTAGSTAIEGFWKNRGVISLSAFSGYSVVYLMQRFQ